MSYQLWKLEGGKPVFVGADDRPEGLDVLVRRLPKGTVIAKARDGVVNASNGGEKELKLFRAVVAESWRKAGGEPPAPLPVPTEAPTRRLESLRFGCGKRREEEDDEEEGEVVAVAPAPKVGRPATRPPLARRRTTSVAGGTLTSTPVVAAPSDVAGMSPPGCPIPRCIRPPLAASARCDPAYRPLCASHRALAHRAARTHRLSPIAAVAHVASRVGQSPVLPAGSRGVPRPAPVMVAPVAAESAELQLVRERATNAERALDQCRDDASVAGVTAQREAEAAAAKIAGLQRLLGVVSTERDTLRDRADAAEMARFDAAHKADEWEESHAIERARADAAEAEKLEALGAEAYAWDLVDLAMRHGLAAGVEARAETTEVLRQAGELSRLLGAAREELDALRAAAPVATVPAQVLLDELMFTRVAAEAARLAVRATREDLRLRALAATFPGGVDELERLALGYADLLRQTGTA
ncbi:MAG: hypothetical protein EPO40_19660 [Myxococcaceae bacterium]|nr:MAG: hypothetical protein EPO40_19660 [Myxococcaceae bacterium]